MKILIPVIKTTSGAYSYAIRLARGLREYSDFEVEVAEYGHITEIIPWLMSKKALSASYDVVISNSPYAFRFRNIAKKLIVVEHHSIFATDFFHQLSFQQKIYNKILMRSYIRQSMRLADHIVAVSECTARLTRKKFPHQNVSVIHNWIETDRYIPLDPDLKRIQDGNRAFELLYVGSLSARKGAKLLPEVAAALGDGFVIKCVSKDVSVPFSERPKNLVMLGSLDDEQLVNAYQSADAIISLSSFEGFGYTLAEALSCGKPVVAFDLDAFREILPSYLHGYLAKRFELSDFFRCCSQLRDDLRANRIVAQDLSEYARKNFSPEMQIQCYKNLFVSL